MARALSKHPLVHRVDLLTRLVADPKVDSSYGRPEDIIEPHASGSPLGGCHLIRLPCGDPKIYLRRALQSGRARLAIGQA